MKARVDYILIGTGVAPLIAAQRIAARGETAVILNPDSDFFLENSELPLDLLHLETSNPDLSKRFSNNLPEQVYRDLIPEFPGALEMAAAESDHRKADFHVESAPWIRSRHRLWVAFERNKSRERVENLYLRMLDLGWKPKWLEGISLAKRFPGFSARNLESRDLENAVGFEGPRFGDIDVARYRTGLLEFVREKLGRDQIFTSAHILDIDTKGVRFQGSSGLPLNIEISKSIIYFWTPRMERLLRQNLESYSPRSLAQFESYVTRQAWEEWDLLSRDPVNPFVVAHLDSVRVWSYGEGLPPLGGWSRMKVMRREQSEDMVGEASFQDISKLAYQFMGWERLTVRSINPRTLYRWNSLTPMEYDSEGVRTLIIPGCDGPLHWIATQVRRAIEGV